VLGVLLAVAFSIAAEGLFFTALAVGVFLIVRSLAPARWAETRAALPSMLPGLLVAGVVAGALLAYPLYMHFAGPQTFDATGFNQREFSEDAGSYLVFGHRTLGGWAKLTVHLAPNETEETSFFGGSMLVLVVASLILLWRRGDRARRATLRALAIVAVLFIALSLGPRLHFMGTHTSVPMLYAAVAHLPLFDAALPGRFALVVVGVFGVVLALTAEELLGTRRTSAEPAGSDPPQPADQEDGAESTPPDGAEPARPDGAEPAEPDGAKPFRPVGWRTQTAFAIAFVVALVPLVPLPVQVTERSPEPAFIADGIWKQYVPEGGALTALPFAINMAGDGQRWQAYTMARGGRQFRIPDGYFLGPAPKDVGENGGDGTDGEDGTKVKGRIGAVMRHTDWLFLRAGLYGYVASIGNRDRELARADFEYWGVYAVFLPDTLTGNAGWPLDHWALQQTATDLLGQPERVGGVLLWPIRPGVDPLDRRPRARVKR
jgi:hypothetical protein